MPLNNYIPKHLQDTFAAPLEHVYYFLTGTRKEDLPVSRSKHNNTLPTPSVKEELHAIISSKSMYKSPPPRANKRLDDLLEGSYGSEIVIEDEEERKKQTALQNRSPPVERIKKAVNRSSHGAGSNRYRSQSSQEEDWYLGRASRKLPADATRISTPMSRTKDPFRSFGHRPLNTLDRSPAGTSTRDDFYKQQRRRTISVDPPGSTRGQYRESMDAPPRKRQKLDTSPGFSRDPEIINLDDSQEVDTTEPSSVPSIQKHQAGAQGHTASRSDLPSWSRGHTLKSPEQQNAMPRTRTDPVQYFGRETADDLAAGAFTRSAKQERQHREAKEIEATSADSRGNFRSSVSPARASFSEQKQQTSLRRRRSSASTKTPAKPSRLQARLAGQSPDELQSDSAIHSLSSRGSIIVNNGNPSKPAARSQKPTLKQKCLEIPIKSCVGFAIPDSTKYTLVVNTEKQCISIDYQDHLLSDEPVTPSIPFTKIIKTVWPQDKGNHIALLQLSNGVMPKNMCFVEFCSEKGLRDFELYMQSLEVIKDQHKSSSWLLQAMAKHSALHDSIKTDEAHAKSVASGIQHDNPPEDTRAGALKKPRLAERVDSPSDSKIIETSRSSDGEDRSCTSEPPDPGYSEPARRIRHTRSSANLTQSNGNNAPELPRKVSPRRAGEPWKNELVYPPNGRKRETVSWDDLSRLEDDEFLNDNLVGLFLRYLQEHSDQERLKAMHFFSSFFFEKLVNHAESKSTRKQINYKGVASWTKNLNLFSRDFVIVPVNENLHWYVMIICNLPELRKRKQAQDQEEELETVDLSLADHDDGTAQSTETNHHVVEDLASSEPMSSPLLLSRKMEATRKGNRRFHKPAHRKYDVKKPIIITLDSLNIARSATATVLKQYIVEEAKEKLQLKIESSDIQGMTAKGIPLQSNYSDCGLYVCMYVEQFMQDPYAFVRRILQREDAGPRWPKNIESRDIRQKFYHMLQELHSAQKEKRSTAIADVGNILITMLPEIEVEEISTPQLTPADIKLGVDFFHRYKAESQHSGPNNKAEITNVDQFLEQENRPVDISDDERPPEYHETMPGRLSTSTKSKYFDSGWESCKEPHEEIPTGKTPAHMVSAVEDSPIAGKRQVSNHQDLVEMRRLAKSTTEFMTGEEYASAATVIRGNGDVHDEWKGLPNEVPETQEMTIPDSIKGDDDMLLIN